MAQDQDNKKRIELAVKGMTCESCELHIENDVKKLSGVSFVKASYEQGSVIVEFDEKKVDKDKIISTINATGYKVEGNPSSALLQGKEKNCTASTCEIPTGDLPNEVNKELIVLKDVSQMAAKSSKAYFLLYFPGTSCLNIDLSKSGTESNMLLRNILLPAKMLFRWKIIQLIFHHGYRMTDSDRAFLKTFTFNEDVPGLRVQRIINIYAYNALGQKTYIEWFEKMHGTVYTILSAKFNQIVGHGFLNFISLANNYVHKMEYLVIPAVSLNRT